jgi:hypothetical protein
MRRSCRDTPIQAARALCKNADEWDDLVGLVLQDKVTGVDQVKFDLRKVALVGIRAVGWEDLVVLPHTSSVGGTCGDSSAFEV